MRYMAGMSSRVMKVASMTPKPRLMAMGMRKRACSEVSKIIGSKPKNVVREVRMMKEDQAFVIGLF